MKKHLTKSLLLLLLSAAVCSLNSCRKEETGTPSSGSGGGEGETAGTVKGFFLLNEGNQGSNKASLDYFDYETGVYTKNIYPERNPGVVKELGDLGNDLQVYGEKLYAVIGGSGLVEVMDVNTAKHVGQISVPSGRRLAFKDQYVYISSYAGPLNFDPNARKGYVARVDTAQLGKVDTCVVGYQPEDIVVSGNKLYVANSGGYRAPVYDSTVSVIDLSTFKEIYKINVAINIQKMRLDRSGNLWVSTPGNYYDIPSRTFVIDTKTDKVTDTLEVPNANMALRGDSLLLYSATWDMTTGKSAYDQTDWSAYEALLMKLEQDIVYKGGIEFPREGADLKKYLPRLCAKHPEWDGQTRWNPQLKEIRDLIHAGKDYDRRQTSNKKKRSRGGEAR